MIRYYDLSLRIGPKAAIRLSSLRPFITTPPLGWFETDIAQYLFAGTGNPPYSFWTGTQKTTYSNDTNALLTGITTTTGRAWACGAGNATYGYFAGGYNSGTKYAQIDKMTYSTDTNATNANSLAASRDSLGGSGNASAVYFVGGRNSGGTAQSNCQKVNCSTDVVSDVTGGSLGTARYSAGCASSPTALYTGPGVGALRKNDKMPFSTETNAYLSSADVGADKQEYTPIGNNDAMYMLAGSNLLTTIMKMNYATDTTSTLSATATGTNGSMGSQCQTHGYMVSGYTSNYTAAAHKFAFSTETIAAASSANSVGAMLYIAACG